MTFAARTSTVLDVTSFAYLSTGNSFNNSLNGIGGTATATVRLSLNGSLYLSQNASLVAVTGQWRNVGASADYEAQGTWQSGTGTTGGPSGWVSLSSTQDWTLSATNNAVTRDLLLEIRLASTSQLITSATITCDVDSAL